MSLTVIVLDKNEKFLQVLNPEMLSIEETNEKQGFRTISMQYEIDETDDIQLLFKTGNKLWISNPKKDNINMTDCLYVMNAPRNEDYYEDQQIILDCEEVLTELNYAPPISQTDIIPKNGFNVTTINEGKNVLVNYEALNYWFGDYFEIGIVQECLSSYLQKIVIKGTMNLMNLLRYIEDETGNIFVTRYEKDVINNKIHRYLDFLNKDNANANFNLNIIYNFPGENYLGEFDENNNKITKESESNVMPLDDNDNIITRNEPVDNNDGDLPTVKYKPTVEYDVNDLELRIVDLKGNILTNGNENLSWDSSQLGLNNYSTQCIINLTYSQREFIVRINDITYHQDVVATDPALVGGKSPGFLSVANDPKDTVNILLPNQCKIQLVDTSSEKLLYQQTVSPKLGNTHSDVLDVGYSVETIQHEVDESETFTAFSPIFTAGDGNDGLTTQQIETLITRWKNLSVTKGELIPMIVQKVSVNGKNLTQTCAQKSTWLQRVTCKMGVFNKSSNYFVRPLKPQDNINDNAAESTYEFFIGTAYWKAPFSKRAGELFISDESINDVEYSTIQSRYKNDRIISTPKMGHVETSAEDIYAIYNDVAMKLKEKRSPKITVEVKVANFQDGKFNDYQVHDRVYVKIPYFDELISAIVTKTVKNPYDITENTVELSNYSINTKVDTIETVLDGEDISVKYPQKAKLTVTLHDVLDNVLSNKVVSFSVSRIENGSATLTRAKYNRTTNSEGKITLQLGYNPGTYEITANFGGDELYEASSNMFKVNIGGTKKVKTSVATKKTTTKKTSSNKKTSTKKKVITKYWGKCGQSPDKKEVISIAQPSGRDAYKYKYNQLWRTIFKNKCPFCGRSELRWDDGKKNGCIKRNGHTGNKTDVPEGEITCNNCDCDFDGVTGLEKDWGSGRRLTTLKKPVKTDSKEKNKLINGKLIYSQKTVVVKTKTNNNGSITRRQKGAVSSYVKKKALSIVGNKVGQPAMMAIVSFMDNKIDYRGYENFQDSAETCLKRGSANCCDGTRLFFELCDAAGLTEYYKLEYIHVYGHVYGKVTTRKTGNWRYVDCASDWHGAWGYVCQDYRGRAILNKTQYPNKPF